MLIDNIKEYEMNDSISPLSSLDLPGRVQKILEESGVTSVDVLVARLEDDPKSILSIGGIGPKTLLNISAALESYEIGHTEQYSEPVQSLGDQFKSMSPDEPNTVAVKAENQEKIIKEKKDKGKKSQKVGKKKETPKKFDKKKQKKSEKNNGKKKGKKSKKSKGQKAKKNKKK